MNRIGLSVLLTLSVLAGCVKAPPVVEPDIGVETPSEWSVKDTDPRPVAAEWWLTFDDPSLNSLIETALQNNKNLQAAVARVDRAQAEARLAGADLKPQIGVGLSAGRQRQNFVGLPLGQPGEVPSTTFNAVGLSLDTSWEVDLWGRLRAKARGAVADLEATESELRGAKLSLAGQTAKIWFAVAEAEEQMDLARRSAESFRGVAEQIRSRYEIGVRPATDLRLALSNLEAAQALLARREREFDIAVRQLEVVLGEYPDKSLPHEYPVTGLLPVPPPVPAGIPSELVGRRPDLVAAERRFAATGERLLSSKRALYPRFSLTLSGGTASTELGDLVNGDFGVWSLLGNLTQPIFQGGRLRADIDRNAALSDEALALYADSVLRAYAEVESALASETYLREREEHLVEAARQTMAAERLAGARYKNGVGDYLTLLESQSRAVEAQGAAILVRRLRLDNRIDLFLALGGGFEAPADQAASDERDDPKKEEDS